MSVGVVTTGAVQFPDHHLQPATKAQAGAPSAPVLRPDPVARVRTVLVAALRAPVRRGSDTRARERGEADGLREQEPGRGGKVQQADELEPAEREPVEVEPVEVPENHDGDSSNSGAGSDSSGSGHSGSPGGDSPPDGSDD
ncbi:MAG: hypothetical protein ACXWZT_05175 [Gaiellaceae bacterium]